jgi:hypothetical protein
VQPADMFRAMTSWRLRVVISMAVSALGCAHAGKPVGSALGPRNEEVLALAMAWLTGAAPPTELYSIKIDGRQPSLSLLNLIAGSGLLPTGARLGEKGRSTAEAQVVELQASRPVWVSSSDATVAISYAVEGTSPIHCTIVVRAAGDDYHSWLLRTPSDVECWPRPGGVGSESSGAAERADAADARGRGRSASNARN